MSEHLITWIKKSPHFSPEIVSLQQFIEIPERTKTHLYLTEHI